MTQTGDEAMTAPEHIPPKGHKVLLDNEWVRVLEVRIKPGSGSVLLSRWSDPGGCDTEG